MLLSNKYFLAQDSLCYLTFCLNNAKDSAKRDPNYKIMDALTMCLGINSLFSATSNCSFNAFEN